jgi:hypothetical protein
MNCRIDFRHWILLATCFVITLGMDAASAQEARLQLFDMAAIRDPSTLEVEVMEDWHVVGGTVPTRQKFVTINVGLLSLHPR